MTYSAISKAPVIGFLLAFVCSSVAFSDQGLGDQKAVPDHDETPVISEDQQRRWEIKMLSWQQNLADSLQKKIDKSLLLRKNVGHHQDWTAFSAELTGDRERIVQK